MKDDKTNIGTLFDIPAGAFRSEVPGFSQHKLTDPINQGIPTRDKHYYATHAALDGKTPDLVTTFVNHYEIPDYVPTFNSTIAQWAMFEKYNIAITDDWFKEIVKLGEEVLVEEADDHETVVRVTQIVEWAKFEIGSHTGTFPEALILKQLEDTQFNPIVFDSLSQLESRSASKSLLQFDQPKPKATKKKKKKNSNRTTAHRNQTVGGGMMALLGRGTTVDPEQGVGINGMLKRLQRESKAFEDRVAAAGLNLPDIGKGETFASANPGKDVSEFENVKQETQA